MPIRKPPAVKRPGLNRPSVTEQMEKVKRLGTHEMFWVKEPGRPLRKAALWRGRHFVKPSLFKQGKDEIHTHSNAEGIIGNAFPSKSDLKKIRNDIDSALDLSWFRNKKWVVPTIVVVSTNKEGKEIGRTIVRPMAKMKMRVVEKALMRNEKANEGYIRHFRDLEERVEALDEQADKQRFESLKALVMLPDDRDTPELRRMQREGLKKISANKEKFEKTGEEIFSTLKKMGFRLKFIAKPGYRYNPYMMCFEKKH